MPFATVSSSEKHSPMRVIVKFTGSPVNDACIDDYLAKVHEIYQKNKRFVILYDARKVGHITPVHLWKQAKFMREKDGASKELIVKASVCLKGSVARQLLSSLFVLKPPVVPLQVFEDIAEAKKYLSSF